MEEIRSRVWTRGSEPTPSFPVSVSGMPPSTPPRPGHQWQWGANSWHQVETVALAALSARSGPQVSDPYFGSERGEAAGAAEAPASWQGSAASMSAWPPYTTADWSRDQSPDTSRGYAYAEHGPPSMHGGTSDANSALGGGYTTGGRSNAERYDPWSYQPSERF